MYNDIVSVASVDEHHPNGVLEGFLCRKCRNIIRESFYLPLKEFGFPKIQPLTYESDVFGVMLLAAMGRGVIAYEEYTTLVGDEVEYTSPTNRAWEVSDPGYWHHPFVYVGYKDRGELERAKKDDRHFVISGSLFWR